MSEQEKKSNPTTTCGPSVLVVEQTQGSRQKQPFRPHELEEEPPETRHKRSRAPAVPSVGEELKDICPDSNGSTDADIKEQKEKDLVSHDKQKQQLAKKFSSSNEKTDTPDYETITLVPLKVETKLESLKPPYTVTEKESIASHVPELRTVKKVDEDSIKDEILELRTPEVEKKHSEWSDEEEAGGLPRSETRASRVSRKVRTFFCCGVPYEAASEDDVSTDNFISGI